MSLFVDMMAFPQRQTMPMFFGADFPRPAIVFCTAAPPLITSSEEILVEVRKTLQTLKAQPGVTVVRKAADITDLSNGIKVVLGLQHPPLDATPAVMISLRKLGIRFMTIAYKGENIYGGGFLSNKSLTAAGSKFLQMLQEAGMWMDFSHIGHATARDILKEYKYIRFPILATHTGAYKVYDNPRNLPVDILEGIVRHHGVVGLYTLTFGLDASDNSLEPFRRHLMHLLQVCGENSVAIGTDGIYETMTVAAQRAQFELMNKHVDTDGRMRSRHPVEPLPLNGANKDIVLRGYLADWLGASAAHSEDLVNCVMFGNALNFLRANL